ncbi:MAG: TonB family protein [Acidobacteriota bacterium]|nr:TonB family protein [Acidobacteriota bacterium]
MRKTFLLILFILVFSLGVFGQEEAKVSKNYTKIHTEPSSESKTLSIVSKDEKLTLLSANSTNGWYAVSIGTVKGWVIGTDIILIAPSNYRGPITDSLSYVNSQYNFQFTAPPDAKIDGKFNDTMKFIASYTCLLSYCDVAGIFSLAEVKDFNATVAQAVRTFQQKSIQESIAKEIISGFKSENNATVLSKQYVAYDGRPAMRIDYNFTEDDKSFTGALVQMFIDEKKLLIRFAFLSLDSQSEQWNKTSEKSIRSFTLVADKLRRPNVRTIMGDSALSDNTVPPIPKQISGGVLNGKATSLPKAEYPAIARPFRASGAVNVQVTIDEDGTVTSAKAVSGSPYLRKAAEDAALQAKFNPTLLSGQKVKVTGVIVYNFIP